ncbi:MAG TPA: PVC-type heme-binding CxxCH protein [Verrucomicrobiae bacterium]|nr:PVC-type heme-binding CxxCH protein [Verrucomicrobiae bacterium]
MVPPADAVLGKLPAIPPKPAAEAAKSFRVLDGFRMDLLAAEPLLASPVAMAYDEDGRAYVCEMRDYPYTDKAHHLRNQENPTDAAIGTVRLLEDTDGDGVFDKSTIFAESLSWPTGVACWKGGVFVAATPDIWYFKDIDGDGKADLRRKVFTGFRKLNVQSVMNNLVWGLDNHIHGAGSSNGGQIRPADNPAAKPFVMGRNDFRFDPLTFEFELLSGGARFGGTFDDWGHRFLCDIRNPAQQVVLPQRYLARNPFLATRSALHDMAEAGDQLPVHRISEPELWRVLRARRWSGERDIVMPRSELVGAGVVTSSSGITCYRGDAYPEKYRGNVFVCEVAGNLLYRLQLTPDGPTFKATRADEKAEMVASTDNWFRPVNFVNAPDGALHVVDMYRENIEHPWSIPDDIHAAVDLERGRERGRIWRLTPPNFKTPKPPRLGSATTPQLVATLENANSWWRETAQRLLFERQDPSAVPALRQVVRISKISQARLHALWTLAGLKKLNDDDVIAALRDPEAGVRENAIKLTESRSPSDALFNLAADPDATVRFQLAFTLGEFNDPRAIDALVKIAFRDAADPWIRAAILSSVPNSSDQLLAKLPNSELTRELAQIVGARGQSGEIQRALASGSRDIAFGVGEGLKRSGKSLRREWDGAGEAFSLSTIAALNTPGAPDSRIAAIRFLVFDDFDRVQSTLKALLNPSEPQEIQIAAVAALGSFAHPDIAPTLLSRWSTATPAVRAEIVNVMLSGRNRTLPLLQAIDHASIPANQIPFARRAALQRSGDPQVKNLAAKIFGDSAPRSKKETLAKYQASLSMKGDAGRGKKVFEAACATCHRAGDIGRDVGPNLATIRQWNPEQILINILDPNREVAPNFLSYSVETKDGRNFEGIIVTDAAASVTIQRADAVTETILRRDIAQISGSGLSLMPDGLEAAVSVDQMADLLAFLRASP